MQDNFYTVTKPLIIFLSSMGIVPYCFENNKLCTSYLYPVYSVLLIVMHVIINYIEIITMQMRFKKTPLTSQLLLVIVGCVLFTTSSINAMTRKAKFMQFATAMKNCENAFKDVARIQYRGLQRKMYILAMLWLPPRVFLTVINYALHVYFFKLISIREFAIYTINFYYSWCFCGSVCIFAVLHVSEIKQKFSILNESLKCMLKNNRWEKSEYETFLKQKIWKPDIENLAKIGRLHLKLTTCIRAFNDTFAMLLTANYVMSFIKILMAVYMVYVTSSGQKRTFVIANNTMIALLYMANMTLLCCTCSNTSQEVNACLNFTLTFLFS